MPLINCDAKSLCSNCGPLPVSHFGRNKARSSGYNNYCKSCLSARYLIRNAHRNRHEQHGAAASPTYQTWADMKTRCDNPQHKSYRHYGARGITYCDDWKKFSNFLRDMGERPAGLTLERINNDGPYEKANCRWATRAEQNRNKWSSPRRRDLTCHS